MQGRGPALQAVDPVRNRARRQWLQAFDPGEERLHSGDSGRHQPQDPAAPRSACLAPLSACLVSLLVWRPSLLV